LARNHFVRCLVRTPSKLNEVEWRDDVELVVGSIEDPLDVAMADIDVAVYLIHGIGEGSDWVAKEQRDAEHFRRAAERARVQRIIYLGGMGAESTSLSDHLSSRHQVGRTLSDGPIPVCELRAAVIIGSGSASFEMLRCLVDVLPVMVTPKWVATKSQPIAVSDVLAYLVKVIESPTAFEGIYEIGGPDVVSYAQLMDLYAEVAGLRRRRLIPVPLLSPRLSSHWVGVVTPVPASLARPLVDSLVNEVIVRDTKTVDELGAPQRTLRDAITMALSTTRRDEVPTTFKDADLEAFHAYATDPSWSGGKEFSDVRERTSSSSPGDLYDAVTSLGGTKGWHHGEWLWRVRGLLDTIWGGPGLRRGRRSPTDLRVGDYVDFWRVVALEPQRFVKLRAEMLMPGEATLEWRLDSTVNGSTIRQSARFKPRGLLGRAYWYSIAPFHFVVFAGLLRGVIEDAERH
jgi:uncharacterized protein YbjT (DUF2867 family)